MCYSAFMLFAIKIATSDFRVNCKFRSFRLDWANEVIYRFPLGLQRKGIACLVFYFLRPSHKARCNNDIDFSAGAKPE